MVYSLLAERVNRRPSAQADSVYRINVTDFEGQFSIGVYDAERLRRQRVRINLELTVAHPGPGFRDDIAEVLSYETIVLFLRRLAEGEHISLLETLCERILAFCLEDPRVRHVVAKVEKLDVFSDTAGVGVTFERSRPAGR